MNKKLSLQICIIFVTIVFSIFFLNKIFFKENFEIVENKEIQKSSEKNLIEGIQYFSKDIKGNTYLIEAENGIMDQNNQDIIYLKDVKAKINFDEKKKIKINSKRAIYNINNFDTEFFKGRDSFRFLRQSVLPKLMGLSEKTRTLTFWSAGCSTGQEPYSLSIMLEEALPKESDWEIKILATD